MVFAAGAGTRLIPLTAEKPKHLLPVGGKPVLWHVLSSIRAAGILEVGITVHHMKEQIVSFVEQNNPGLEVEFIDQKDLLGTADALHACSKYLRGEERFMVAYGDVTLTQEALKRFMDSYRRSKADGAIMAVATANPSQYGVVKEEKGILVDIAEKPSSSIPGKNYVNAGIYVLSLRAIELFGDLEMSTRREYELTDILKMMVDEGSKVAVHKEEPGWWFDIGKPWDLLDANFTYMEGIRGNTDSSRFPGTTIVGQVAVGRDVTIKPGSYLEGPCIISDNVSVGANCSILSHTYIGAASTIGNGVTLHRSLVLDHVEIGDNASIHYSIIGDGAVLGSGVCVSAEDRRLGNNIRICLGGKMYDTGRKKLGAVVGSNSVVAPMSALSPGKVIMPHSYAE